MVCYIGIHLIRPPLPASLVAIYMAHVIAAAVVFLSIKDERWRAFWKPVGDIFMDEKKKIPRAIILILLPLWAGYLAYAWVRPKSEPPIGFRIIHPAPPNQISFRGKSIQVLGLKNPMRSGSPEELQKNIEEGKNIYYQNCFFCHGDNLDGRGIFAQGLSPIPANFTDVGTIGSLQESFVFWRVAKGGPGLPKESTPWHSAMPAWESKLTEEEIWKVILYLYEGAGVAPRTWEEHETK